MNRYIILLFCVLLCKHSISQPISHVVVISIDGLRPDFYLDKRWCAPNVQRLMNDGLCAKRMKSVLPSFTYPSHVAMLTGALPARSGICYNAPINSKGDWNWYTRDIKVPTLWQVLRRHNMTTAAVQWPVSVDSNITWNVPEIWNNQSPEDRISESRKYATKGLVEELEMYATGKLDSVNMNEEYSGLDENSGRMASYIFRKYKPNFLAVHFAGVDGAQHEEGRAGEKVKLALANVDDAIGNIIEAVERSSVKDSTAIIVVGDHGFADIRTVLRPNIWLAENNLSGPAFFQPAGGSAFLYARDTNDSAIAGEVLAAMKRMPPRLRKMFHIIEREKLDKIGADSSALFALSAVPGTVFGGARDGSITLQAHGGHHGYDPNIPEMHTGFIAAGAGIKKGVVINELCVADIAPLIAALLGISFSTPDGVLHTELLK